MIKTQVRKKDNSIQDWDPSKVLRAINLAARRTTQPLSSDTAEAIITYVAEHIEETPVPVTTVHKLVENALMHFELFDIAREYITYRQHNQPDIFRRREVYRPFEYPDLHKYADAIRQSYWTHDEFDFTSDIQDFLVNMSPAEQEATRRTILAIAHVEATVKTFWARLGDRLPKPELAEVGITFGESEVRHANAYAELLNILGLNEDFAAIAKVPVFKQRKQYMDHALSTKDGDDRDYLKSIMYFSLFIENVSLFSQFLIIMMINQKQGYLKGTSNVIASTSLEEQIHANFGIDIVNKRRIESPSWFTEEWSEEIEQFVNDSFQAESAIIDWIFEQGEIPAVPKSLVLEYIKSRFNKGLTSAGFTSPFSINHQLLTETEFFDLQLATTTHVDFFHKRSSNYTKKAASYDADSLF